MISLQRSRGFSKAWRISSLVSLVARVGSRAEAGSGGLTLRGFLDPGFVFPFLKNFTGAKWQNNAIAYQADEFEPHGCATLPAKGKGLLRQQSGLMHETVSIMVDAIQAAARHTFTRPEVPHKTTLPRQLTAR